MIFRSKLLWPVRYVLRAIYMFLLQKNRTENIPADLKWLLDQEIHYLWLKLSSTQRIQRLRYELNSTNKVNNALISLIINARYLGDRDNNLERLLDSLVETTQKPKQLEIIIKVDGDDTLHFFNYIKQKYENWSNIRFIVSSRGRGWKDLHVFLAKSIASRSPTSRLWVAPGQGSVFSLKNWDTNLFSLITNLPNDLWLGTQCTFEKAISVRGPIAYYPIPAYHFGGEDHPTMGYETLKCIGEVAKKYPGWTMLGPLVVDCFVSDILRRVWEKYGLSLHLHLPRYESRQDVSLWVEDKPRLLRRAEALNEFISDKSKGICDEIADALYKRYTELKNSEMNKMEDLVK